MGWFNILLKGQYPKDDPRIQAHSREQVKTTSNVQETKEQVTSLLETLEKNKDKDWNVNSPVEYARDADEMRDLERLWYRWEKSETDRVGLGDDSEYMKRWAKLQDEKEEAMRQRRELPEDLPMEKKIKIAEKFRETFEPREKAMLNEYRKLKKDMKPYNPSKDLSGAYAIIAPYKTVFEMYNDIGKKAGFGGLGEEGRKRAKERERLTLEADAKLEKIASFLGLRKPYTKTEMVKPKVESMGRDEE